MGVLNNSNDPEHPVAYAPLPRCGGVKGDQRGFGIEEKNWDVLGLS